MKQMNRILDEGRILSLGNGNLVRIGVMADGSCFYHSLLRAISSTYIHHKDKQALADNMRLDIALWLLTPAINPSTGREYKEREALYYLNTSELGLRHLLQSVRDPYSLRLSPYNDGTPLSWAYTTLYMLLSDNEVLRLDAIDRIMRSVDGRKQEESSHAMRIHKKSIRRTIEAGLEAMKWDVNSILEWLRGHEITLDKRNEFLSKLSPDEASKMCHINRSLAKYNTLNCILGELDVTPPLREYAEWIRRSASIIRSTCMDPSTVRHNTYSAAIQNSIIKRGLPGVLELLPLSINANTGRYFTKSEVQSLLHRDIRKDFIEDPRVLSLSPTLNYFVLGGGRNIHHYNDPGDDGTRPASLPHLLKVVLPRRDGDSIYRMDAGEEDIIPMVPYILGVNIHIITLPFRVYRSFECGSDLNVCLLNINNHFEVIGSYDDELKTVFASPITDDILHIMKRLGVDYDTAKAVINARG